MIVATHNGTFHADETTACAILSYLNDNFSVIRSRDAELLEKADLIIDVGLINDEKHYDHHSKEFTLSRDNGIKYATAGIIWNKFGFEFLKKIAQKELKQEVSKEVLDKAQKRIDEHFMELVDLNDNGQLTSYVDDFTHAQNAREKEIVANLNEFYANDYNIPTLVAMMNLPDLSSEEQDKAFMSTVKILKTVLVNTAINSITTEIGIEKVLKLYNGEELLILHEKLPWTAAVLSNLELFKNCKLAMYPDRNMRWRVQSLPLSRAYRFKNRCAAPISWRGLNDEELDKQTGLQNLTFIHKSGFTGGAGNYDDCLSLAKLWLKLGVEDMA